MTNAAPPNLITVQAANRMAEHFHEAGRKAVIAAVRDHLRLFTIGLERDDAYSFARAYIEGLTTILNRLDKPTVDDQSSDQQVITEKNTESPS